MRPTDLAQETWSALTANKGRSALTILGIVIGIGAVIAMTAIIGGISEAMAGMFGANAARILTINLRGVNNFTLEDAEEIVQNVSGIDYIVPTNQAQINATYETKKVNATVHGATSKYFDAHGSVFLQGAPFSEDDNKQGDRTIILDQYSVKNLFGSTSAPAVGKSIKIGNDDYVIGGVIDKIGMYSMSQYDDKSIEGVVPINTAIARLTGDPNISSVEAMVGEDAVPDDVAAATSAYLAKRYRMQDATLASDDDSAARTVSVNSNQQLMQEVNSLTSSFQSIMVTVSGISLLVGGIGIMNMMLTNVTERIREIGLRKALGAKRIDITSQFILESICLCLAGGFIGVVLGLTGAFALSGLVGGSLAGAMTGGTEPIRPAIDPGAILGAVLVCVLTGLIFGWYPARRAARLDPVESLNHQ